MLTGHAEVGLALATVLEAETKWANRHPSVSAWTGKPNAESERR
jgi:amidase